MTENEIDLIILVDELEKIWSHPNGVITGLPAGTVPIQELAWQADGAIDTDEIAE